MPPRKKGKGKAPADRPVRRSPTPPSAGEESAMPDAPDGASMAWLHLRDVEGDWDRDMEDGEAVRMAERANGYMDLDEVPNGLGEWYWLNPRVDARNAEQLGFANPLDYVIARERREVNESRIPRGQRPRTLFVPDSRYWNPDRQPAGHGQWAFLTTTARNWATERFRDTTFIPAGQEPTALDVWRLRQHFRHRIDTGEVNEEEDITRGLNIVWVPDESTTTGPHAPETDAAGPEAPYGIDEDTLLPHNPLNDGDNDQTGVAGVRIWKTTKIRDKIVTVDRSRVQPGSSKGQEHKKWVVDNLGRWYEYDHEVDWKDVKGIKKFNRWREQAFGRVNFPAKRKEKRTGYTDEEKEYLGARITEYIDRDKLKKALTQVTDDFNKNFPTETPRTESGILTMTDRLRKKRAKERGPTYAGVKKTRSTKTRSKKAGEEEDDTEDEDEDEDDGGADDYGRDSDDREDEERPKREDDDDPKPGVAV